MIPPVGPAPGRITKAIQARHRKATKAESTGPTMAVKSQSSAGKITGPGDHFQLAPSKSLLSTENHTQQPQYHGHNHKHIHQRVSSTVTGSVPGSDAVDPNLNLILPATGPGELWSPSQSGSSGRWHLGGSSYLFAANTSAGVPSLQTGSTIDFSDHQHPLSQYPPPPLNLARSETMSNMTYHHEPQFTDTINGYSSPQVLDMTPSLEYMGSYNVWYQGSPNQLYPNYNN